MDNQKSELRLYIESGLKSGTLTKSSLIALLKAKHLALWNSVKTGRSNGSGAPGLNVILLYEIVGIPTEGKCLSEECGKITYIRKGLAPKRHCNVQCCRKSSLTHSRYAASRAETSKERESSVLGDLSNKYASLRNRILEAHQRVRSPGTLGLFEVAEPLT